MTIMIEIKPEVETELSRQAAVHGIDLSAYASSLLEGAARAAAGPVTVTEEQLDRALQELSQFSRKIPLLPDEAFSRESLYNDHQ